MAIPAMRVAAPPVRPTKYGLFSVSEPSLQADGHWTAGTEWESGGCIEAVNYTDALCDTHSAKTIIEADGTLVQGTPFGVYIMRECRAVGDYAEASDKASKMLHNAEEHAVEAEVWARFTADTDAVDITPATAPSVEVGIAMLEAWMGDTYAGAPTLHLPRDVASYAGTKGAVERHGNHLETVLGSFVSAGNGYGTAGVDAAAPAAGTRWLFASSTVAITRGQSQVRGPFLVQDPLDNTQVVLAERVYVTGYECTPVGIRVTFP